MDMVDSLTLFSNWIFTAITSVWNFAINNDLVKYFIGYILLSWIVEQYRKYTGK